MSFLLRRWFVLLLVAFVASGCQRAERAPLQLATNLWPGYEPLYLAQELGYLDKDLVRLAEYTSASEVMRAYRSGRVDLAALTLDEALLLNESAVATIILLLDFSNGADAILGSASVAQLSDIKGKRVGVEGSALGAFFFNEALKNARLQREDVQLVPLGVDEHESAFLDGRVDAVVTFEPVRGHLLRKGAHVLFDSAQIPGKIVDVLVVRPSVLSSDRAAVQAVVDGWFKALARIERDYDSSLQRMNARLQLDASDLRTAYQGIILGSATQNRKLFGGQTPELTATATALAQELLANGLLKKTPRFDILVNPTFFSARHE